MPHPPSPHRPLRLALQFFASHGLRKGLNLLARRVINRRRGTPVDSFTDRLATPFDLYPRHAPPATHPFDLAYDVDTSGFQHGAALGDVSHVLPHPQSQADPPHSAGSHPLPVRPPLPERSRSKTNAGATGWPLRIFNSALWNTAYYGIAPSVFDRALALLGNPADPALPNQRDLPIWSRFTFVDLGCGKGRALLLASRYPFHHILGVELDSSLAAIAQANLRSFQASWQRTRSLEVRHADAITVDLPSTPLVLYLYNPFLAPILKRVLRRLEISLRQNPRELWLVYINPSAAHVLRSFPSFRLVAHTTLSLDPEDALPDRLGSTEEEIAVYHVLPPR